MHLRIAIAFTVLVAGCADAPTGGPTAPGRAAVDVASSETPRHIVVFRDQVVPADFVARVELLGGHVDGSLAGIGVGSVSGLTPAAAAELASGADVEGVSMRAAVDVAFPEDESSADDAGATLANGFAQPTLLQAVPGNTIGAVEAADDPDGKDDDAALPSPTLAEFYARQWDMRAVSADAAWATGHRGTPGVTVSIMDSGIDYLHPDLAGLVDLSRSKSYIAGEDVRDLYRHGTAVAEIIASNAKVLAGMTQRVRLIAMKVYSRQLTFDPYDYIDAIVESADRGADVINASFGGYKSRSEDPVLYEAYLRAFSYAQRKGALFIGLTGNDHVDHDNDGDFYRVCELSGGMCVAATAPIDAPTPEGPFTKVDSLGEYSGYGLSVMSVVAPGGRSIDRPNQPRKYTRIWHACSTGPTTAPGCPPNGCPDGRCLWESSGTSFAAPHVAGLAALLISRIGQHRPLEVKSLIEKSADDLGAPGFDKYYGWGRINAASALRLAGRLNDQK